MPTVLVSPLPKLPFSLLFTMDFLSQLSSKVIVLPRIMSAGDDACLSAVALAGNETASRVVVGAKWQI